MNTDLHDLMTTRSLAVEPPALDIQAIAAEGGRRVRRRRVAAGSAVVCLSALAVGLGPALMPDGRTGTTAAFAAAFGAAEPSYALGKVVHVDGRQFEVPTEVLAFVQTTRGVVYSDAAGDVWSATGDSDAVKVGTTTREAPRLVADGAHAAWGTAVSGGRTTWTVLDQSSGKTKALEGDSDRGEFDNDVQALDGTVLYLRDARGLVAWDFEAGTDRFLGAWRDDMEVVDVENGTIAHQYAASRDAEDLTFRVGPALGEGRTVSLWNGLDLSPDATRVLGETEPDTFAVFDTASGETTELLPDGYAFFIGYRWVDAYTYLGLGLNRPWDPTPVDLLRCDVGAGCEVAAPAIGSIDAGMVLPIGKPMDG